MDFLRDEIDPPGIATTDSDAATSEPRSMASLTSSVGTFRDVIAFVRRSYPPSAAGPLASALRRIAWALVTVRARATGQYLDPNPKNLDLAGVAFDLVAINEALTGVRYRMAGFNSDKSLRNAMSALRRIGRDLGNVAPHRAPELPSTSGYQPLLSVAKTFEEAAARRFAGRMTELGRRPDEVTGDDLNAYGEFLATRMLGVKVAPMLRRVVDLWRRAAERHPEWPQIPPRLDGKSRPANPPFSAYPLSLQEEIEIVRRRMEGSDQRGPFDPNCDGRPLRPATAKLRIACIRATLGAHVALGNDPGTVTSLTVLLSSPSAIQNILQELWRRGRSRHGMNPDAAAEPDGGGITGQLDAVAVTLTMLTRYFPPPPDALVRIRWLISRVRKAPMSGMTRKNRRRIDQFLDPVKLGLLLNLPRQLMSEALKLRGRRPAEAARLARAAIFFAVEVKVPLRMKNLHSCRLGYNLRLDGIGGTGGSLSFQAHEMKNHRDAGFFVGERTCHLLRMYIEKFLPFFAATSPDFTTNQWLFPAGDGKPGPLSAGQVSKTINDIVAERVGAEFNPHLFRALALEITLKHDPAAHERARQLLGDGSMRTVLSHYAPVRTKEATEHQDQLVDREAERLAALTSSVRRRRTGGRRS
jgi:hypothetical protein